MEGSVKRKRRYVFSGRHRCRATALAVDGPCPSVARCVRKRGHKKGRHRDWHGFHFDTDSGLEPDVGSR